ncbi:MAG: hypothetical protein R3218_09925, partial [Christiangramia sp.]|nr:hypothetical protein [Christiangramia sp.]
MKKKMRCIVLIISFLFLQQDLFGQFGGSHPPEPMLTTQEESTLSPCGSGDGGTGSVGIPPPKGLCLPINDYLIPLFISGVCLGAFSLLYLQK